ncbi:MAG: signal peptide peptidase SppA [Xanthomonadaceae bacterium]|nr:signal peptide peptidase SppA [Xanthomonadaceae bacterium]MDP2185441.1 signal peptide peptidase SppA [Xanthomonadales bacterium]MDZ4116211.1 signal peptide peptidase SppA [Xanthomonadaceae bacterium]MDZ4377009.1 signal peptide peptidase SppA [Xanthomonadaceae bacterium]
MSDKPRGLLVRLAGGVWRTIDFSRRFVFNMLFLLIMLFILAAIFAPKAVLHKRTALVIAPNGDLVEQYRSDPGSRALAKLLGEEQPEVQLRDLLKAIKAATTDKRIERIVLRADTLGGAGMASLREVADALRTFRAAGKEIIAYGDSYDQRQYLLAAQANEVYLHPGGSILLEGLARFQPYFREGLQDKLGVEVHLFRVGEYKSAAEPFILDGPSPEAQTADLYWMNDVWQRYLADISAARGIEPSAIADGIEQLPQRLAAQHGDLGKLALSEHLVDGLMTQDQVRDLLIERGVADEDSNSFRQIDLESYLGFVNGENLHIGRQDTIAVVVAQGEITDGEQAPGTVGGVSTAALIREAREDEDVKALLLRVDSPGGGVFPSEQIRREVELTRAAGIPVVVSMGDVAASGGYWIAMNADVIFADPSTITGSIGIFGLWMSTPNTLAKIGVRTGGVGTTRFAGAFDPTRPFDPAVGEIIQSVIDAGYAEFTGKVAAAREQSVSAIDQIARGRVWSGAQAKERGLVDELGGLRDALARAAELAKLDTDSYRVHYIEAQMSPFEQFMSNMGANAAARTLLRESGMAKVLLGPQSAQIEQRLQWLGNARSRPVQALAHCFCGL